MSNDPKINVSGSSGNSNTSDAAKEETWLGLAKLSQESFFNRRDIEWNTAFGLWTAIGACTYFTVINAEKLVKFRTDLYGIGLIVLTVVLLMSWQLPLRRGFEMDKRWKHYYMHRAAGASEAVPKDAHYFVGITQLSHLPWTFSQIAVTGIFLFAAWMITQTAINQAIQDAAKLESAKKVPTVSSGS